ncbi:hypothetical protein QYE76_038666 [Lolium multiflorum]|uniref:Uncharacterized protein n=1 Tax=Lolium multiflorum TaxID=4521 RepID=A0AAD8T9E0_LOLMU|nr:hypothetical protein QYE76_038666 [Lolium multiflorum]
MAHTLDAQSVTTPASSRHLEPSLSTSRRTTAHWTAWTHAGPRERQARRPRRRASATVTHAPVKLTVASEPRFPHRQARQPRQDTSNTMSPSLASSPPWNDGDDDDPSRAPQPPLAPIKGEPLPSPEASNRKLEAAASSRSSPEQEATPGSAAATRGILVLDNDAAHPSGDRRSPQAPSDPLLPPPVSPRSPSTTTRWTMEPYVQTETYDLENGGSLVFERDLYLVSERLERPPPQFHGVRIHDTPTGEQQWMITADLKGSSEPPISERILFSFKACNWPDGLAHALQEGLARVCGQNIAALRGSRFAHFARHDTMGEPMALSSHPVLKIHVQHLDFMLHETRKELELTRVHNHRAQMALAHHADAIRMLAKDRKSLRLQRAKKDATISRLREKIRTLEVTVRTQQDQIQEMEEDGDDIQGGDDFLSDDNDFEDDEFTDEEDYAFLESEEDGIIPIDVDEDDE